MGFEDDIAELNEFYFFREFTFAKNTFRPSPTEELELADNILWLDDLLVVYQLKERYPPENTDSATEKRWMSQEMRIYFAGTKSAKPLNGASQCLVCIDQRRGVHSRR